MVVDCFAEWCKPCKQIAPVFRKLAQENPHVLFLKADMDKVPELGKRLGVFAMPTFVFLRSGKKVGWFMGASERLLRVGLENGGKIPWCSLCTIL